MICRSQLLTIARVHRDSQKGMLQGLASKQIRMANFVISAEGIADDRVVGVVADQTLSDPHLCLFRIETLSSRSMGALSRSDTKLENKANKASFEKSQGAPLKYGQQVQMRHVHSGRFLSLNLTTAASTPGAWSVSVSQPSEFLSRKITLLPFTRSHNIGDTIKNDDAASLVFQTENLRYFLQAGPAEHEQLEIHSTHKPASWKFARYENYSESAEAIKFGTPVIIRYSKMAVHMALEKPRSRVSQRKVIVTKGEIEDYSDYWILQHVNAMKGGCAKWNSKFYIKNALTGEYIVPNPVEPGDDKPKIRLQPVPDPSFYFTFPKPNSFREDSVIPFEYPLLIKSSDGNVLTLDQKKTNEEALDHLVPAKSKEQYLDSGEINVDVEPLWADKKESLFDVTAVDHTASKFFNYIRGLVPKFSYIKTTLCEFAEMKIESNRKLWEAAEFIEKRLECMRSALKFLLALLREATGLEQFTYQRIFTGLRLHTILIDIAEVLHTTFDVDNPQSYAIEQLAALAEENLELIWDLLRDSMLENSSAARLMYENERKLCDLLKYDTRRIGALLTEIFRLVDPDIDEPRSFYHKKCDRLETLTKKNLTEQVIYLKIIRNLCEIDDVGVLEYQREVTWHLFNSEISFEIISLSHHLGDIAIKFGSKGGVQSLSEFTSHNPELTSLYRENNDGQSVILLKDLSALPDYVEYVQAALMLYHCICRGKGVSACELAGSRLGITLPVVYHVAQDLTVHIEIRQACLFLLEAFCITAPPYEPYTETDTSFNYAELKLTESQAQLSATCLVRFDSTTPYIPRILRFVFDFWMRSDLPACFQSGSLEGQLNYLKAMLRVTLEAIEYQHCSELYAHCVLKAMLFLLAGFTEAANSCRGRHWSTDLVARAVKAGQKERSLELLVNELLACVLTTILTIKKISRRTLLSRVVRFLISKPSVFKTTLLGVGILPTNSLKEITDGLRELLDEGRPNKLILDFLKHAEKERGKKGAHWGESSASVDYIPDFDFRDMATNAPDLKESFIRVILEWFSFSPFLKEKMLEVMSEVFKEKKLFEKSLKYVDVYSLGPVSEMYNRLRWIKENSEFDSLLIRAKFESSLAGKSTSITRISSILEYVINFIHPLACTSAFILRKTQNIVRHLELHKDLFELWGLIQYLDKIGKENDSPTIRLKSGFSSFLYLFARDNPKNAKELEKLLRPQHHILTVPQYPAFLRLINDFNHISLRDLTRLIVYVLDEARQSDRALCMLCLLEYVMIDRQGNKKRTIQNVVSTILAERVAEALKMFQDRPIYEARLIRYLSLSAEDNPAVIAQCRYLLPLSQLQELMQREDNAEMLGACLNFLYAVYVKKTDDVKTLNRIEDLREILQRVMKLAKSNMRNPQELVQLVAAGSYSLVYFTRTPGYTEMHMNTPPDTECLSRWTFLYNQWDGYGYGVLVLIPEILEAVQLDYTIQRGLIEFYYALDLCLVKMKQIAWRLDGIVSFGLIIEVFEKCLGVVKRCLASLNTGDLTGGAYESYCDIPDKEVEHLRAILSNSLQFPLMQHADSEIEVDEHMGRIIKAGYQHYQKEFFAEDESAYIKKISDLIDPRIASGSLVTKKDIKEAIPLLLRKIKRLQRLFSSPKQRTFLFKILEGIIPDEDRIGLKLQLNPLFENAEMANYALTAIMRMESIDEVNAALVFLRKLFHMQSREFMDSFRTSLDEGSLAYPLFIQIQKELENMKSSILTKATSQMQRKSVSMNLSLLSRFVVAARTDMHEVSNDVSKHQQMVVNLLLFMQICCDNCNEPFQIFYRTQLNKEGKADVDMVSALANFLVDVRVVKNYLISNKPVFQVLDAALSVLVDFVTGPCASNQTFLGNNVHIYLMMNMLINMCQGKEDPELLDIHNKSIEFLSTLLEGHPDPSVQETMSRFLDLAQLRTGCETIYEKKVKGYETLLSLQSHELTETHKGVVEAALLQAILLVKMKYIGVLHDELMKFEGSLMEPTTAFEYYSKYIGYVEIDRNGELEPHFFPIPWKCKYITPTTRLSLVVEVNRSSHQEKIEDFISRLLVCRKEMEHQQYLYRFATFKRLSGRWQLFGKISYYLALLINVILLMSIQKPDFSDLKGNFWAFTSVAILGVMQIMAYMACFFFNIIEYYPKTVMSGIKKPIELEMQEFPAIEDSDCQAMHRVHSMLESRQKLTYSDELKDKLKEVLLNFDMYYTYSYFMISITAVYEPVFYPFLLLDMIKQTPELANVLKSVTQNFRQLILTMWLGVIIIYLFAIFAFVYYNQHFNDEVATCDDLWNCFFSTLNIGIRSGGGVGDGLNSPENDDYWSRMVFDMFFFMINIIILLNIIFGIIIDTFAELRDERMFILEDIHSKCYVCGQDRSIIEMKGSGWSYHFMCEHSAFAYLSFLTYISEKKIYDCNGLEKHVKERLDKSDASFMPTTSITMNKHDESDGIKDED